MCQSLLIFGHDADFPWFPEFCEWLEVYCTDLIDVGMLKPVVTTLREECT